MKLKQIKSNYLENRVNCSNYCFANKVFHQNLILRLYKNWNRYFGLILKISNINLDLFYLIKLR